MASWIHRHEALVAQAKELGSEAMHNLTDKVSGPSGNAGGARNLAARRNLMSMSRVIGTMEKLQQDNLKPEDEQLRIKVQSDISDLQREQRLLMQAVRSSPESATLQAASRPAWPEETAATRQLSNAKFWRSSMQDERGTTSSLAESKRTLAAHTQAQMMLGEGQLAERHAGLARPDEHLDRVEAHVHMQAQMMCGKELLADQHAGLARQDEQLDRVEAHVGRVHTQAQTMRGEVQQQITLIDSLHSGTDGVRSRVTHVRGRVEHVLARMNRKLYYFLFFVVPCFFAFLFVTMLRHMF